MFLRAGVPYRIVGGTRFFDRAEIRDVMAYLKMIVNPADEVSVKRVINTPRRGIGTTTIERIDALAQESGCSFFQACELACAETGRFTAKARRALGDFVRIVREGRRMDGELQCVVENIVDMTGLVQALSAEGTVEAESRVENIREFLGVAAEFEETHDDIEGTLGEPGRAAGGGRRRDGRGRRGRRGRGLRRGPAPTRTRPSASTGRSPARRSPRCSSGSRSAAISTPSPAARTP